MGSVGGSVNGWPPARKIWLVSLNADRRRHNRRPKRAGRYKNGAKYGGLASVDSFISVRGIYKHKAG